jgi:hypothetical protein
MISLRFAVDSFHEHVLPTRNGNASVWTCLCFDVYGGYRGCVHAQPSRQVQRHPSLTNILRLALLCMAATHGAC